MKNDIWPLFTPVFAFYGELLQGHKPYLIDVDGVVDSAHWAWYYFTSDTAGGYFDLSFTFLALKDHT